MKAGGQYDLESELGRGGMGVVYRARDTVIGRMVAVKALHLEGARDEEQQARFGEALLKEARAAGTLSHPNIVTIHHVIAQPGEIFIVMELVEGCSLREEMRKGRLSRLRALELLEQAAAALDYAHQHGVIHRDVKPGNFMVRTDGILKLTDFGIAKLAATNSTTITTDPVGTPQYMSPEQILGGKLDGRSDEFSLAVVAWELLTGKMPFAGDSAVALLYNIAHSDPTVEESALPAEMRRVLMQALSKNPRERYTSCSEFVSALGKAASMPDAGVPRRVRVFWAAAVSAVLGPLIVGATIAWVIPKFSRTQIARPEANLAQTGNPQSPPSPNIRPPAAEAPPVRDADTKSPSAPATTDAGQQTSARKPAPWTGVPQSRSVAQQTPPVIADPPPVNGEARQSQTAQLPSSLGAAPAAPVPEPVAPILKRNGILTWGGAKLGPGETVVIDGMKAQPGYVTGSAWPARTVRIRIQPEWVVVTEMPAPGAWTHLKLKNNGKGSSDVFQIHWEVIE